MQTHFFEIFRKNNQLRNKNIPWNLLQHSIIKCLCRSFMQLDWNNLDENIAFVAFILNEWLYENVSGISVGITNDQDLSL